MNRGNGVKELLARYIAAELLNQPGVTVGDDEDLLGTGVLDSLSVMSLVHFVEQEWGIAVPAEDIVIEHFESLTAIEAYLARRGVPNNDQGIEQGTEP